MSKGFSHSKVTVMVGDGLAYMRERVASQKEEQGWDVIITDSSDPVGPAEGLFGEEYYQLMHQALREGGIICTQGEFKDLFPIHLLSSFPPSLCLLVYLFSFLFLFTLTIYFQGNACGFISL